METSPQQLSERAREMQAKIAPQLEEARENLIDLNQRAIAFIKERPGTCLLGALAFGFIVGKLASRRW
ncbi:MAG: hypothetical protein M3Y59_13635 [Myxococcota bacterium]|nr:hypothetical protein [Myxococcota bacterium]